MHSWIRALSGAGACVASPVGDDPAAALFCVYDGHGDYGTSVSMQILQSIHYELDQRCATELRVDPEATLIHAFHSVQVSQSSHSLRGPESTGWTS